MTLGKAANIATIALALFAALLLLERRFVDAPRTAAATNGARPLTHLIGQTFPLVTPSNRVDRQIVLVLSTKCGFCQESVPFYREIQSIAAREPRKVIRLAALFHQPLNEGRIYLETNGLTAFEAATIDPGELSRIGIPGTPAVVILNENGVVLKSWMGLLSERDRTDIVEHVNAL